MANRKSLKEGLKATGRVDPTLEQTFVYGDRAKTDQPNDPPVAAEAPAQKGPKPVARVPLTTRMRGDFAAALKRASLERQLASRFPNTLQDILEEALEPWLRTNGYLD